MFGTRFIYLVEGEEWLKQFEKRRKIKLKPIHVFVLGTFFAAAIMGGAWIFFG